jgi:hypothetical protein
VAVAETAGVLGEGAGIDRSVGEMRVSFHEGSVFRDEDSAELTVPCVFLIRHKHVTTV